MRQVAPDAPTREEAAPLVAAEMLPAKCPPGTDARPRPTGVLVIEDDRLMLKSLARGLSMRGFAVWCAADGGEAVGLYQRFGAGIDVVLSDLNMPVMDGPRTLEVLREIDPLVRFCFMTADASESTLADLSRRGAMRVFTKPFASVSEVAEELRELATRPPSPALPREEAVPAEEEQGDKQPLRAAGGGFVGWVVSALLRAR